MDDVSDELIILGSGGGRFMMISQQRSTGGMILRLIEDHAQIHIDPGPGAIRDLRDFGIDPCKTTHIFLTHHHTDHSMSLPVIIEAMQQWPSRHSRTGTFFAPTAFLTSPGIDPYYLGLLENTYGMVAGETRALTPHSHITGTPAHHDEVPNIGYIVNIQSSILKPYSIAFTSDTAAFPEYTSIYHEVDILVVNLLRPADHTCRGHLCTAEFIPLLRAISPRVCIVTHFGQQFTVGHLSSPQYRVEEQIAQIQSAVGEKVHVIGAYDGLRVRFSDYLPC